MREETLAGGVRSWPLVRQFMGRDKHALGAAAISATTAALEPRTATADRVVKSICPYCAIGTGQKVYVKNEQVVQVEGDPDSPISRGRLCPKGSATRGLSVLLRSFSARVFLAVHRTQYAVFVIRSLRRWRLRPHGA
jgi:formate dehydrogenase major subunit